jgi:hypothetical protein
MILVSGQRKYLATNGFANTLLKPARAQVLITEPIENLDIKELSFGSGLLLF